MYKSELDDIILDDVVIAQPVIVEMPATPAVSAVPDDENRRVEERLRVNRMGLIATPALPDGLSTLILDTSPSGMRIQLSGKQALPPVFWLIDFETRILHECRIAWRRPNQVGLKVVQSLDSRFLRKYPRPIADLLLRRARQKALATAIA